MDRFAGFLGIAVILGVCWLLSTDRRAIRWRTVFWGLGLQAVVGILVLKTEAGRVVFDGTRAAVTRLLGFTDIGAGFLFGNLYRGTDEISKNLPPGGMTGHVQVTDSGTGELVSVGMIVAIHILPTLIFFSSLMAILYHLGVMQRLVSWMAWLMQKTMGTSGSESLSCSANIFVGPTEAPLLVRPFVGSMTMSELMAVMVGGFATVAGGVFAAYVRFGIDAGHLLTASVMSAPAALVLAKMVLPETQESRTQGRVTIEVKKDTVNLLDAAASGAGIGLKLALNVGAMLLAFIALVALVDFILLEASRPLAGAVPALEGLSLSRIFGWVLSPLAWVIGVPWSDAATVGGLLGTKVAVNEFLAYIELTALRPEISDKAYLISTYALCGFANLGSIAIQIAGIGGLAPERRQDLARLGFKAMWIGALASALTASIAGILLG